MAFTGVPDLLIDLSALLADLSRMGWRKCWWWRCGLSMFLCTSTRSRPVSIRATGKARCGLITLQQQPIPIQYFYFKKEYFILATKTKRLLAHLLDNCSAHVQEQEEDADDADMCKQSEHLLKKLESWKMLLSFFVFFCSWVNNVFLFVSFLYLVLREARWQLLHKRFHDR